MVAAVPKQDMTNKTEKLIKEHLKGVTGIKDVTNKQTNKEERKLQLPKQKLLTKFKFYCSLCGVNCTHNSNKCEFPKSWHNNAATFENRMGGSKKNLHLWHDKDAIVNYD